MASSRSPGPGIRDSVSPDSHCELCRVPWGLSSLQKEMSRFPLPPLPPPTKGAPAEAPLSASSFRSEGLATQMGHPGLEKVGGQELCNELCDTFQMTPLKTDQLTFLIIFSSKKLSVNFFVWGGVKETFIHYGKSGE